MGPKTKNMKFTDLKDMLKKSGEEYADKPAFIFKTETAGKFKLKTHK